MYFTSPVSGGWLRTAPSLLLLLSLLTAFSGFGQTTTTSFTYNGTNGSDGSPQFFTIPTGITQLTVVAFGAQGGGFDGKGGRVDAVLTVTQTLTIYVGGQPTSSIGGYNGGGNGVDGDGIITGGGGGATDIRLGGTSLLNRILVAGGGGAKLKGQPKKLKLSSRA